MNNTNVDERIHMKVIDCMRSKARSSEQIVHVQLLGKPAPVLMEFVSKSLKGKWRVIGYGGATPEFTNLTYAMETLEGNPLIPGIEIEQCQ